jgi:MarR family transcriptional regulator, multiple antibiotic resistance protein MarR
MGNDDFQLEDNIGFLISQVKLQMSAALDTALSGLGITHAQWVVLVRIAHGKGRTGADLCRCANYDTGSMTRMLDRLEEKNLIVRERSVADRRVVEIKLTEHGKALIPELQRMGLQVLDRMSRGFSVQETDQLKAMLRRMICNVADEGCSSIVS